MGLVPGGGPYARQLINAFLPHGWFSPSLSPSPPLSKKRKEKKRMDASQLYPQCGGSDSICPGVNSVPPKFTSTQNLSM